MKIIELSDHVGDKIRELVQEREDAQRASLIEWKKRVGSVDSVNRRRRARVARAWRERRRLAWLFLGLGRMLAGDMSYPVRPVMARPGRNEIIWREGQAGEQRVVERLARQFDDRWTLLQGYHNPLGEIDQILVGPGGVHAIEVKYKNGVVHCAGDRWWVDRYDKYGNCVERNVPFRDNGGRSPARQLSEPCRMLAGYLSKPIPDVRIHRHVVLSHASSRIGNLNNLTIDSVSTVGDRRFPACLFKGAEVLDDASVNKVVELIEQSHRRAKKLRQGPAGRIVRSKHGFNGSSSRRSKPAAARA